MNFSKEILENISYFETVSSFKHYYIKLYLKKEVRGNTILIINYPFQCWKNKDNPNLMTSKPYDEFWIDVNFLREYLKKDIQQDQKFKRFVYPNKNNLKYRKNKQLELEI